jgi:DNA-binding GntR family transcriptional regulator
MDLRAVAMDNVRRYKTAQAMVADGLREAILRGVVKGGEALRQEDIAEQFGVSRGPVREALRQLEGEGLVDLHAHRGAVVAKLHPEEVIELSEIRVALETLALRLAIPEMDDEDLRRAEEILDQADQEPDLASRWGEFNQGFHLALYEPADRPYLVTMIRGIFAKFDRYMRTLDILALDYTGRGQQEHRELLEFCKNGDVRGAEELLERHVRYVDEVIASALAQSQGDRQP